MDGNYHSEAGEFGEVVRIELGGNERIDTFVVSNDEAEEEFLQKSITCNTQDFYGYLLDDIKYDYDEYWKLDPTPRFETYVPSQYNILFIKEIKGGVDLSSAEEYEIMVRLSQMGHRFPRAILNHEVYLSDFNEWLDKVKKSLIERGKEMFQKLLTQGYLLFAQGFVKRNSTMKMIEIEEFNAKKYSENLDVEQKLPSYGLTLVDENYNDFFR